MSRKAVITLTPDDKCKCTIDTGGVQFIEILDSLNTLMGPLANMLVKEYQEITGEKEIDDSKLEEYMNFLRKNKIG